MSRVEFDGASRRPHPPDAPPPAPGTPGVTRATAFGLDVCADSALSFLDGAGAARTGRTLEMSVANAPNPTPGAWPSGAELICDQREADGAVGFQIEAHPRAGYRIWGPSHGTHLLSPDGRRLESFPGDREGTGWQRLLVAQVLPFAAALRGLEVFHAGAVLVDGGAIAFAGPSGSGKSSTVVELCRGGASFIADDVLALEQADGELLAHPGTPLASVDRNAQRASRGDSSPQEVVAGDTHELMVRMPSTERAAPLRALFFLDRRAGGPDAPRFEPVDHARMLLTATFNFVLASPDRLRGLLEVCALAASRRAERIVFGPRADPSVVVAAVQARLRGGA